MNGSDAACSASLRWDISGNTITPDLEGELYLTNSLGMNARVQVQYFDIHGVRLNTINGALKLATSNADTFPIHINGYSSPLVYRVDVSVTSIGQDVGSGGLVNGLPVAPATLAWDLGGNTTTARLTGDLYMINSLGVKAHVRLKTFDVHGLQLNNTAGTTREPTSNVLWTFPVSLSSNPNPLIYRAEVSLEVLVGATWTQVGSTVTVFI